MHDGVGDLHPGGEAIDDDAACEAGDSVDQWRVRGELRLGGVHGGGEITFKAPSTLCNWAASSHHTISEQGPKSSACNDLSERKVLAETARSVGKARPG